ncbi:MAG: hypothetical protein IKT09_07845 [Synergistes sp.]|nr:hypothetical protein [Synergistes sp.]
MNREELQSDLLYLEPKDFYIKHIVKSHNWYFSDYLHVPPEEIVDKMDFFKEIVSKKLGISFHSLQIVGSAKTGYSLSPSKLFSPFHDEVQGASSSSDIDIAIISERLFLKFWDKLRKIKNIWHNQHYYKHLTESIFRGYINDKDLLKIDALREEWEEMIRPVNFSLQDKLGFVHPISYRLYRSWDDLEEYQIISITKARKALEV